MKGHGHEVGRKAWVPREGHLGPEKAGHKVVVPGPPGTNKRC